MNIPFAANGNLFSCYLNSLEKPEVLHFPLRHCSIHELNAGQGIDPHNHILNLIPTTAGEGDCINTLT